MAFNQNPAVLLVGPVMGYPAPMRLRRPFPASRGPGIGIAFPPVIAGHPHMVTAGSLSSVLGHGMWRPDLYDDICGRSTEDERACEYESDESIKKHTSCFACAWPYSWRQLIQSTGDAVK